MKPTIISRSARFVVKSKANFNFRRDHRSISTSSLKLSDGQETDALDWKDKKIQRTVLNDVGKRLQLKSIEDWYKVSKSELEIHEDLKNILSFYSGSLVKTLMNVYSEYPWNLWHFEKSNIPKSIYNDISSHREYFVKISKSLGINLEDQNSLEWTKWYKVKTSDLEILKVDNLLKHSEYGGSFIKALILLFPEFSWKITSFNEIPSQHWNHLDNQVLYLEELYHTLGFSCMEDWYRITNILIIQHGGKYLVHLYDGALDQLLMKVYPNYHWIPWKFIQNSDKNSNSESNSIQMKKGFWKNKLHLKEFIDGVAKQLNINKQEDWYSIEFNKIETIIIELGGNSLLKRYDGNIIKILQRAYPSYDWQIWRLGQVPSGYWNIISNRKKFFDELGNSLGYKSKEDWYNIKGSKIDLYGGSTMIKVYYDSCYVNAITSLYSEYPWIIWKFNRVPKGYWDLESNCKKALEWLSKELNIYNPNDWKEVTEIQIRNKGLKSLLDRFGGKQGILEFFYPNQILDFHKENQHTYSSSKAQRLVFRNIRELLGNKDDDPDESLEIYGNYPLTEIRYKSGEPIQLDIFVPSLKLAIEYQGEQHYQSDHIYNESDVVQTRDKFKREACNALGITLVEIPYWWDQSNPSLAATIHKYRPDIPLNIESKILHSTLPIEEKLKK